MIDKRSKGAKFSWQLIALKHWLLWFGLLVWWLVIRLPFPVLLFLGKGLGLLFHCFGSRRKSITKKNIEVCFPEMTETQRASLVRDNFINMGIAVMEVGMAWWWPKKRLAKLLHIEGLENLSSVPSDRGVMLLGIHYTTLEIGGAGVSMNTQMDGMYRAHGNPVFDYIQARGRISKGSGDSVVFERSDVRGTMKALKSGRTLWYGPDQDYGLKQGLFAPFFGLQAATVYATARFAEKTGAAVVPFNHVRLPGSQGYKLSFLAPLEGFPCGNDLADATRINKLVEDFILLQPDQYLWAHRRFKNRPAGEADLYQL